MAKTKARDQGRHTSSCIPGCTLRHHDAEARWVREERERQAAERREQEERDAEAKRVRDEWLEAARLACAEANVRYEAASEVTLVQLDDGSDVGAFVRGLTARYPHLEVFLRVHGSDDHVEVRAKMPVDVRSGWKAEVAWPSVEQLRAYASGFVDGRRKPLPRMSPFSFPFGRFR